MYKREIVEYSSKHRALAEFREMAAETLIRAPSYREPLKRIVGVGVPFGRHRGFISRPDRITMIGFFSSLISNRIPVTPDFAFKPLDLRYGQDFLDPKQTPKADGLFLTLIAGIQHPQRDPLYRMARLDFPPYFSASPPFVFMQPPHFCTSPFDTGIESWQQASERTGAKVIMSKAPNRDDISANCFNSPDYTRVFGPYSDMTILVKKDYAEKAVRPEQWNDDTWRLPHASNR